ncbi:MAG: transglycosylase domain-containing protein, partial [Euzebyaceae bacterium]|nr:transglycosylase domain-containing protein [Euzebyaceae bacterium]
MAHRPAASRDPPMPVRSPLRSRWSQPWSRGFSHTPYAICGYSQQALHPRVRRADVAVVRRWLPVLLACALSAAGCSQLVQVEAVPLRAKPASVAEQTLVYASDGSVIATLRVQNRVIIGRDDVPQVLIDAVLGAEDRRFYRHDGIDLRAIARAAIANQRAGTVVQGGSTITQQLVKNRYFP